MKKNFLQDVVPPNQKRSIRNIPIPEGRKSIQKPAPQKPEESSVIKRVASEKGPRTSKLESFPKFEMPNTGWGKSKFIIGGGVAILLIALILLVNIFTGAKVSIYPKFAEATVNETLVLTNRDSAEISGNSLTYRIVEVGEEKTKTVRATGQEEVEEKASGKIKIFNNYTTNEQPLVKNTRFETASGLIYRIDQSVTVPGMSEDGKAGTLEVLVFADGVGDEYNIPSADFTIPGFKGQDQFDGFSAKTETELSGGFKGIRKIISENDLLVAEGELKNELRDSLDNMISSQKTDDVLVLVDDSLTTFGKIEQRNSNGDDVEIALSGTLKALVISDVELSKVLATETLSTFNQSDSVLIDNEEDISVSLSDTNDFSNLSSVIVDISGKARFVWQTDTEKLISELAGKNRRDLKTVLQEFPGIGRAEAVIRPFWKRSFPTNIKKIRVEEFFEQ